MLITTSLSLSLVYFQQGGFNGEFTQATAACYARNVNVTGAPWRRMDDMPISAGITHGAVAIVGMKFYMCGGYVCLVLVVFGASVLLFLGLIDLLNIFVLLVGSIHSD
jgi:hypothetical protein